jgi:hypothetical protein
VDGERAVAVDEKKTGKGKRWSCGAGPLRLRGRAFRSAAVSRAPQGLIPRCILETSAPALYTRSASFLPLVQRLRIRAPLSRARPPAPTGSQRAPLGRSMCARTLVLGSTSSLLSPSSSSLLLTRAQISLRTRSGRQSRARSRPSPRSRTSAAQGSATASARSGSCSGART